MKKVFFGIMALLIAGTAWSITVNPASMVTADSEATALTIPYRDANGSFEMIAGDITTDKIGASAVTTSKLDAEALMDITKPARVATLGIGTASPDTNLEVESAGGSAHTHLTMSNYTASTSFENEITFRKSNSDTSGTKAETVNATNLATLIFEGVNSGSNFGRAATIAIKQNGSAGASRVPSDMTFQTASASGDNTSQLVLYNDGNVGIGDAAPTAKLHVEDALAVMKFDSVTLADDASLALETNFGTAGKITIFDKTGEKGCELQITGANNAVNELSDPDGWCLQTDTDGSLDVFPDGDGTYTFRNRLASERTFAIQFVGFE